MKAKLTMALFSTVLFFSGSASATVGKFSYPYAVQGESSYQTMVSGFGFSSGDGLIKSGDMQVDGGVSDWFLKKIFRGFLAYIP